jgi:pimeloyl-ACP methyl ester carboxylesterase
MTYTHLTAPTQFVEANGIRFAYRRFGIKSGVPLLFMQHFRGGMDHRDHLVTDGFASGRSIILFNNAGVASSSRETPDNIDAIGEHAADFVGALGLSQIDILGFSIGGFIAQTVTIRHPSLVRRLILVGTGPRAGQRTQHPKLEEHAKVSSGHQQVKGERFVELKSITQPTLVINGNNDIMVPTINSFILSQHIPNAQLIIYPDSGHASLFQYPELFLTHACIFLD